MTFQEKLRAITENQYKILQAMLEWDDDYCFGYERLASTNLDRKTLVREMKVLRQLELVQMERGGMSEEDGSLIGGTGFHISYSRRSEVLKLVRDYVYKNMRGEK